MNALEICKRIADIEGCYDKLISSMLDFQCKHDEWMRRNPTGVTNPYRIKTFDQIYNPLTDDALCFQLMNKYKVSVDHEDGMCGVLVKVSQTNHWEYLGNICYDKDVTINKAICLAIIEANK